MEPPTAASSSETPTPTITGFGPEANLASVISGESGVQTLAPGVTPAENPSAPAPGRVLPEHRDAPPSYNKLTERPESPAQRSDEDAISEEERRREIAISLLERNTANKTQGEQVMPSVMSLCKRCGPLADLAYTFCSVCAAGVVEPRVLSNQLLQCRLEGQ